jgi:hypothetical protein
MRTSPLTHGQRVGLAAAVAFSAALLRATAAGLPALAREGDLLRLSNDHYRVELDVSRGLGWAGIAGLAVPAGAGQSVLKPGTPARLFEVLLHLPGQEQVVRLDSRQFTAREVLLDPARGLCQVSLRATAAGTLLDAFLTIGVNETCQSLWTLSLCASASATVDVVLPVVEGIEMGEHLEDVGYFFPRDPGLMNSVPVKLQTTYGQYATSQLMAVFSDCWGPAGGGLYLIWQDTSLLRKGFELVKVDPDGPPPVETLDRYGFPYWDGLEVRRGVGLACLLPNLSLPAGERVSLAPVALGVHAGNWRQALADYQAWARTWYEPRHPAHLARYFTFASHHGYEKCSFWAPATAETAIAGIPDKVDQLHFIAQKEDRYGVYDTYREDWGLEGLRRFVAAAHERGKLCSHYVQGTVAHKTSAVYREHEADWGQKGADGNNLEAWANQCMCLAATGWADWLAATCARLVQDLDLDIAYLDCVGWTTLEKFQCHSSRHPHQRAYHELADVRRLFHTVKQAIVTAKPEAALTTEGPLADLFFNDVDGNEGYGVRFLGTPGYGVPIHFMRFLYPRFKYLDLQPDTAEGVKLALFNATATAGDPQHLPEASLARRLFHEHVTAFTLGQAEPHLPTRERGVFCNRFATPAQAVYTVWNHNPYPAAGAFVPVDVPAGSHVVDLLHDREAVLQRVDYRDHLVVDLEPRDLGVFGVLPRALQAEFDGMWLRPGGRAESAEEAQLVATRLDRTGQHLGSTELAAAGEWLDFVELSERGNCRVVLRLVQEGEVLDELELPRIETLDIADGATVSASNSTVAHGAHPESVVGHEGSWQFAWNDEPRPGWLELAWQRPQRLNQVDLGFAQAEYSSRDCEVLLADAQGDWRTAARGSSAAVAGKPFASATARRLRVVFHQGGPWANLVSLTRLRVQYVPDAMKP